MMEQKSEKEDEEYDSKQKGFDWGDDSWSASSEKLQYTSKTQKNASIKQLDLLRYDGLDEVAENTDTKSSECPELSNFKNLVPETSETLNIALSRDLLTFKIKNKEQSNKLTPVETVKRMILGMEYSFEHFKGKNEKLELLGEAVSSHDGNAILAAVLFLRRTLKKAIFQHELIKFPAAVNMYLSYLEEDHETDELANMLLLLGRTEKAAMLKYKTAIAVENVESKIKWLENCLSTHFQPDSVCNLMSLAVSQHYLNLNIQNNLVKFCMEKNSPQENDENQKSVFEEITGKSFTIDTSVLSTVLFSCLYCYNFPETNQFSPPSLKKVFNLNSNQYTWTVIRALSASQKWAEIQDLLYVKNWLGGKKMKCCIGFPNLLTILSKYNAPQDILEKYVFFVEDEEKRLTLAKKYNCHSLVINILKTGKDRQGLIQYTAILKPQSIEYCNASQALNSQNIKWKN